MDVVVLLEKKPDWIILASAHEMNNKLNASGIHLINDAALDLGKLASNDTLFLIGHGKPSKHLLGDYEPKALAAKLAEKNLKQDHRILYVGSCHGAELNTGCLTDELLLELDDLGYEQITVIGLKGKAVYGMGPLRVADPATVGVFFEKETFAKWLFDLGDDNKTHPAKIEANKVHDKATSDELRCIGQSISRLTEDFFNFFRKGVDEHFIKTEPIALKASVRKFRLTLEKAASPRKRCLVRWKVNQQEWGVNVMVVSAADKVWFINAPDDLFKKMGLTDGQFDLQKMTKLQLFWFVDELDTDVMKITDIQAS